MPYEADTNARGMHSTVSLRWAQLHSSEGTEHLDRRDRLSSMKMHWRRHPRRGGLTTCARAIMARHRICGEFIRNATDCFSDSFFFFSMIFFFRAGAWRCFRLSLSSFSPSRSKLQTYLWIAKTITWGENKPVAKTSQEAKCKTESCNQFAPVSRKFVTMQLAVNPHRQMLSLAHPHGRGSCKDYALLVCKADNLCSTTDGIQKLSSYHLRRHTLVVRRAQRSLGHWKKQLKASHKEEQVGGLKQTCATLAPTPKRGYSSGASSWEVISLARPQKRRLRPTSPQSSAAM